MIFAVQGVWMWSGVLAIFVLTISFAFLAGAAWASKDRDPAELDAKEVKALGQAFRVWLQAVLDAGGATLNVHQTTEVLHHAEYLARARMESFISRVCSGKHTGMAPMALEAVRAFHGAQGAKRAVDRLLELIRADEKGYGKVAALPAEASERVEENG